MASGKRQPSKQKRTQQNRQQRAARQARATNASSSGSSGPRSGSSKPAGSLLGRLRGAGASTPAPRRATSPLADPSAQPVGYRAALTGLLAAVAAVVATFLISTSVDGQGDVYTEKSAIVADWAETALQAADDAPDATAAEVVSSIDDWMPERSSERYFIALLPFSFATLLPVIGAYLCFRAVKQRRGAKVVTRTMYATLLGAFLSLSLVQFFLPAVIAVSVAGFQVRKAEIAAARAAAADGEGPGDDEVIEAEVVDTEVVDAEVVDAEVVDADAERD
jgi:hypothetical protein